MAASGAGFNLTPPGRLVPSGTGSLTSARAPRTAVMTDRTQVAVLAAVPRLTPNRKDGSSRSG